MSKAFTKEDDSPEADRLPDLPQSPHPNYVTRQGLVALHDRLERARADLAAMQREDDTIASRQAMAVAKRDIRFLEERINRAVPVDPAQQPPGIVAFGAVVDVADAQDTRHRYQIVGEDEADPATGRIAPFSPLARALLGAQVGDCVDWAKPSGTVSLEVMDIRFPDA
ncbi:GreA/GreB family elongation factor [Sulfitobacter sabulilitoris]|uniref:Transcription elongation factor n=1 Tax=Sulfitobacter sabulilitoris TaxID=2562655 RepID=A0A5S3PLH7_9RHOB|nr:GreA/GreB family elongation factor [Sulfitobacter sabulilitoris]TMM55181.1 transcription elongation factor [Sulfitobacter sabulilitoris]